MSKFPRLIAALVLAAAAFAASPVAALAGTIMPGT
jgi:hypothetical protein